jgi:hypothetical protein
MNAEHDTNLRRAADFCREMRHHALAEACSRAGDELVRLRAAYVLTAARWTQAQGERDEALDALAQAEERIASLQQSLIDERRKGSDKQ